MKKDGYFGGWTDYRHGNPREAKVHRPGRPGRRIYVGEQREHVVDKVTSILRDWESSPFEHEADTRNGLRQALCLTGHGWQTSDEEAAELVAEGLRNLRATRPTWEEGQRKFVDPRENCAWCGSPIRPEDYGVRGRFCSANCAKLALERLDFERGWSASSIGKAAYATVLRARRPAKQCAHCGKDYHPEHGAAGRAQKFCSHSCYHAHEKAPEHECTCEWCGKSFIAVRPGKKFCSKGCTQIVHQIRTGKWVPQRLSPPVFDYFVARVAA